MRNILSVLRMALDAALERELTPHLCVNDVDGGRARHVVAKQMGHPDWSLTAKRYSRWITSDMPDAGQKAVKLWSHFGHNTSVSDSKESGEGGIRTPGTGFARATA